MMEAVRTKLRATIKQQFDAAMTSLETLGNTLRQAIIDEKDSREEKDSALEKEMHEAQQVLTSKLQKTLVLLQELETKLRNHITAVDREGKDALSKLAGDLSKQILTLVDCLGICMTEDDVSFESIITAAEEQSDDLGHLFKDVGDRFIQQMSLPKHKVVTSKRTSKQILLKLTNTARDLLKSPKKMDGLQKSLRSDEGE